MPPGQNRTPPKESRRAPFAVPRTLKGRNPLAMTVADVALRRFGAEDLALPFFG
jgi:hypothetical protein